MRTEHLAIAEAIARVPWKHSWSGGLYRVTQEIAEELAAQDPDGFDRDQFMATAGGAP